MSEINSILLLMVALVAAAWAIAWALGIYVAAQLARRRRRRRWPWILLAVFAGPVLLGTGYLAQSYRRCPGVWVAVAVVVHAAAVVALVAFGARMISESVMGDLGLLLATVAIWLAPLIVLTWLGPGRAAAPTERDDRPLIRAANLHKSYDLGRRRLEVLRGVSLTVRRGEFLAILGASGSGKSTLLHVLGLLDTTEGGSVSLDGVDSAAMCSAERDRIRSRDIGFVFQFYHLLPELTVLENTLLPAMTTVGALRWLTIRRRVRAEAVEMLTRLGLAERLKHRPRELSGGEQQRVAIARALINRPKLLLADEPTGNLDSTTGGQIIELLRGLNAETGQTVVMVTHDAALAQAAGRVVRLRDGKLA